jgi:hypothetical protein
MTWPDTAAATLGAAMPATFLLGTHQPGWLGRVGVPLFVSDVRLRPYRTLPRAVAPWALDSGGFSELRHGRWTVTPEDYIARVRRYRDQIGRLTWAAPQDWMCEDVIRHGGTVRGVHYVGTHRSVDDHLRLTVANLVQLRELAPDLPFIPVLQGYALADYEHCADLYAAAGIDLTSEPLVGLGSVCRRQATGEIHDITQALHQRGITRLHGFGVKTLGLARYGHLLTSADSMAWSDDARRHGNPLPGCTRHKNCANCPVYALRWRTKILTTHPH